ncbi:cell division topological specificity factor MinE [Endozoicomonas sp. SESOKO1]|uniref:cell division topological specificity factor MinE n=1 Tax=Endozoicomonas sp. SESOKO1 TaxID=2828742 RepID=UPI0021498C2E|nr:cell division topological specificity factor MinE [Endozoicomonas sp. SESOKO1]
MNLMQLFRSRKEDNSAAVAKERLQIIVAHERSSRSGRDFLPAMERDILQVIQKYIEIQQECIDIKLDSQDGCSILEVNVQLPN